LTAALLTLSAAFGATAWAQGEEKGFRQPRAQEEERRFDVLLMNDPSLKQVESGLEASATEIYFGDAVYFRAFERNVLETPVERIGAFYEQIGGFAPYVGADYSFMARSAEVEADGVVGTYRWTPEFPRRAFPPQFGKSEGAVIPPGAELDYGVFAVEFPPLEDWNAPFWRAVRKRLATEGRVEIQVSFDFLRTLEKAAPAPSKDSGAPICATASWETIEKRVEKKIVLKRRPDAEMKRLDAWFAATPKEAFPERVDVEKGAGYKIPSMEKIAEESRSAVEIAGKKYSPRLVVRCGNRKPSAPNNPATLDGWRKLEAEFSPSTLRDEITLTRLQLEYYNATTEAETETALKTLVAWVDALPGPQRAALVASITSRRWLVGGFKVGTGRTPVDFNMKEIAPKYERLCDALVPPVEPPKPEPIPIDVERLAEVARRAVEAKASSVPTPAVDVVSSFDDRLETALETSPASELLFGTPFIAAFLTATFRTRR
ncbi:MAG: hypothetical protein IJN32_10770, partial [Thermoguttaceae bacterium]|nr:hypothetical protein [Thermoguttaceae bacterium]